MAKRNAAVEATLTLPGITRPVGRLRKPDALSNAQRQALFRQRQLEKRLLARGYDLESLDSDNPYCVGISVTRNGN